MSKGEGGSNPKSKLFVMNFGRITKSGYGKNQCYFGLNFLGGGGSEKVLTKDILSFFFMEDLPKQ